MDHIDCFNHERPHQALDMRYPAELYVPSTRLYRGLEELDYPFHDRTITVTRCGRLCFGRRKIVTHVSGMDLMDLARPERVELPTFWFVGRPAFSWLFQINKLDGPPSPDLPPSLAKARRDRVQPYVASPYPHDPEHASRRRARPDILLPLEVRRNRRMWSRWFKR